MVDGPNEITVTSDLGYIGCGISAGAGSTISINEKAGGSSGISIEPSEYMASSTEHPTVCLLEYDAANQTTAQLRLLRLPALHLVLLRRQLMLPQPRLPPTPWHQTLQLLRPMPATPILRQTQPPQMLQLLQQTLPPLRQRPPAQPTTPPMVGNPRAYLGEPRPQQPLATTCLPVISKTSPGLGGATCTTGTTFTANVNVSPGSSITYTLNSITGSGGFTNTFGSSGNTVTISNLTVSGAYTVSFTATYTPSGKTAQGSFMFFKI